MVDTELMSILVCPLSRKPLILEGETLVSTDPETRLRYQIDDGIPILLIEEGERLAEQEWQEIMKEHGKM